MDHATPNMPSRDFARTAAFYEPLGFSVRFRDRAWMILHRGSVALEFFPDNVDPLTTAAGACLRLDDLEAFYAVVLATGLTDDVKATPRRSHVEDTDWGSRMFAVVDPDGNLLRCIQNAT